MTKWVIHKRTQIYKNEWNRYSRTEKYNHKIKNTKYSLTNRLDLAKEKISELEYLIKNIQTDVREAKRKEERA